VIVSEGTRSTCPLSTLLCI